MIVLRKQEKTHSSVKKAVEELQNTTSSKSRYKVGFAVDIGTTTIAIYALAIGEKRSFGQLSQINEQTKLGADVMMRIMNAMSGKAEVLHQMVIEQIEEMVEKLLSKEADEYSVKQEEIIFQIVGNTTMCHLFLGKEVSGLAGYPFRPAYEGSVVCKGQQVGMKRFAKSQVKVLSGIAGHVGSDAVAVIGAEKLYDPEKIQLAVDLGTNAEIILNKKGRISVCSAAAGPAFEGKGVSCGMAAKKGAINGMRVSVSNGNIILEIIDALKPEGVCGSGLIDIVSQLRKCNILKEDGYLLAQNEAEEKGIHRELCNQLVMREEMRAFLLYSDIAAKKEIYITQQDIRNIQLAKGAIQAGVQCLLRVNEITLNELDTFVVAGVLGNCLRPENAVTIGLLPDISREKMIFAGNAAGKGAAMLLADEKFEAELEDRVNSAFHVELAQEKTFQNTLMNAMNLGCWS